MPHQNRGKKTPYSGLDNQTWQPCTSNALLRAGKLCHRDHRTHNGVRYGRTDVKPFEDPHKDDKKKKRR